MRLSVVCTYRTVRATMPRASDSDRGCGSAHSSRTRPTSRAGRMRADPRASRERTPRPSRSAAARPATCEPSRVSRRASCARRPRESWPGKRPALAVDVHNAAPPRGSPLANGARAIDATSATVFFRREVHPNCAVRSKSAQSEQRTVPSGPGPAWFELDFLAPRPGFEPGTYRLTAGRSTVELSRIGRFPRLYAGQS